MTNDTIQLLPYANGSGWMIRKNKEEKLLNLKPEDLETIFRLCINALLEP